MNLENKTRNCNVKNEVLFSFFILVFSMAIHSYIPILKNISISFTTYSKQSSENVIFPRKVEFNKKILLKYKFNKFSKNVEIFSSSTAKAANEGRYTSLSLKTAGGNVFETF
jgi:hypothetical protein